MITITRDNLKDAIMKVLEEQVFWNGGDDTEMPLFTSRDIEDFVIDQLDEDCESVATLPLSDFVDFLAERLGII